LIYCVDSLIQSAPTIIAAAKAMNIGNLTTESIRTHPVPAVCPGYYLSLPGSASGFVETALSDILRGVAAYLVSLSAIYS
jgi:hypothetical protein